MIGAPINKMTASCISKGIVHSWVSRGLKVVLYGPLLDEPQFQKMYLQYGVHILLADRPELLRSIVKE